MLEDSEQYPLDLGHNAQHRVHTHAYQHKNPSYVKHSGGGVMIVACFATIGAYRSRVPCSCAVIRQLVCVPQYSGVKRETICP